MNNPLLLLSFCFLVCARVCHVQPTTNYCNTRVVGINWTDDTRLEYRPGYVYILYVAL